MKCLITGATGFVGKYLIEELRNKNKFNFIYGIGFKNKNNFNLCDQFFQIDITNQLEVKRIIQIVKPDAVFHLAGQSFIPAAEKEPKKSELLILKATEYILETLKQLDKKVNFVYVSSCLVYGNQKDIPFHEKMKPIVNNQYSKLKLSTEEMCLSYQNTNIDLFIARPFNHIGIGQKNYFLIPTLCEQILILIKEKKNILKLGNINITRDFLDVRDVVKAYRIIEDKGKPFEIYNICSSKEISITDVINIFKKITNINFTIELEEGRIRKSESLRSVGDNTKIKLLGWNYNYSLENSIKKIYESYLNKEN